MNRIKGYLILLALLFLSMGTIAQEKIVNPEISYAGMPKTYILGGMTVSGVKDYEDYMLTGISGLTVGQEIDVPGQDITDAVKRYWRHGLFSKAQVAADSIVGNKIYLHFYLALRPRVSTINYNGIKKSEREDMEAKLGLLKGSQITPNMIDRAKQLAKNYFEDNDEGISEYYIFLYTSSPNQRCLYILYLYYHIHHSNLPLYCLYQEPLLLKTSISYNKLQEYHYSH